ncbi:hypothetical protein KAR34_07160 [bacterium]|nr:hypothetical protein [bacterium]
MPSAKDTFDRTMKRAFTQIELYKRLSNVKFKKEPKKIPKKDLSELVRAALVLGISAFDAYFTNKFVEKLIPYLRKHGPTDGMVKIFEQAGLDTRTALELIPKDRNERPYRRLRTLVDQHLERYVTQKFKVVDELFCVMGLKNLSRNAEKKAGRKKLQRSIEIAVDRRHAVVHNGDLNSHGNLCNIDYREIKKRFDEVVLFVEKCDEIINSRVT